MGTHPIFESDFDCLSRITKMPLKVDLLNPPLDQQRRCHKKKRLVQSPNSYFMDVKCPGCYKIKTDFSHAQVTAVCTGCHMVLCRPTGGKARLTEGCHFRKATLNHLTDNCVRCSRKF